jgi:hypothetical protein
MDKITPFTTPIVTILLTLIFGFWLSHAGKPYNGILFNVHKLIALGAVIVTVVQLSKTLKDTDALVWIITLLVIAAICVVALFASGALISLGKLDYALMLAFHRIAPVVLVIALALIAYLLGRKP